MAPKAHAVLIQTSYIFLLLIGQSSAGIIPSRGCLPEYEGGEHTYINKFFSYDQAKQQCLSKRGTLPMPTQLSWMESIKFAIHTEKKNMDDEGIWIGVAVTNSENSGVIFTDADGLQLNGTEIGRLSLNKSDSLFANLKNRQLCIVFYPSSSDQFRPQQCRRGRAKAVCRCRTGLRKRKTEEKYTTTPLPSPLPKDPVKAGQTSLDNGLVQGNESSVMGKVNIGAPVNGDEQFKPKGTEDRKENSSTSTVTTILGIFLSVCVVATAYFIVKTRGKRIRDRISRQMPYNRSHPNENGGSLRHGHLNSEDSSGYHRPIHVYEEIFGGNSHRLPSCSSPVISNGHAVATLPRLPPPEPPRTFVEIHAIRPDTDIDIGYMRPSVHRHDGIPGDVRSPPPASRPVFEFPPTPDGRSSDGTLDVPRHELKYASVETVQTLLDGASQSDEEYFVDDENAEGDYTTSRNHCTPVLMKLPEKDSEERNISPEFIQNKRNSVANPYIDVNDFTACSLPPPSGFGEYENERFLRTVMKVPPKKPKRTMKDRHTPVTTTTHSSSTGDAEKDSEVSPTSPSLPLYSKVNKTSKQSQNNENDSGYLESINPTSQGIDFTTGYTPMASDSPHQIISQPTDVEVATYADIPELHENTQVNNQAQPHEYELVSDASKGNIISNPVMLSTTNAALSQSSLACYEIPPEEFEVERNAT